MGRDIKCNLCGGGESRLVSKLGSRPDRETFYFIPDAKYEREIRQCRICNAYFNFYDFSLLSNDFYSGFYNAAIENGKLADRFNRIISLPYEKSDNKQRVTRIASFIDITGRRLPGFRILDVGTGTGVFVYEAKKQFDNVFCVDPDPGSIDLVRQQTEISGSWVGTITNVPSTEKFDLITYNKVLEHVPDPVSLLSLSINYLEANGVIYVELPYADLIIEQGIQERSAEFFIEHLVVYNFESFEFLLSKAGLKPLRMDFVIEPSGKNTIFSFAERK